LFHQKELDTYGKDLLLVHQTELDTVRTSYCSTKRSWIRLGPLIVPPKRPGYGQDLLLVHQKELDTVRTSYWSTKRSWFRQEPPIGPPEGPLTIEKDNRLIQYLTVWRIKKRSFICLPEESGKSSCHKSVLGNLIRNSQGSTAH
jgi:hypothetical protein